MSYAIESKKRKFERILESLTDSSVPPSRASNRDIPATTTSTTVRSTDSSKRRRVTPVGAVQRLSNASTASLTTAHYLPSSRPAFLERLESFRQVTKWHIPSTSPVNAVEWAKRGWTCQDVDTVSCSNCKERLHVDITLEACAAESTDDSQDEQTGINDEDDPLIMANAVRDGLIKRYQDMTVTAHGTNCPWRRRGCDNSIQRIEGLLNVPTAVSSLHTRYQAIMDCAIEVPRVMSLPSSEQLQPDEGELSILQLESPRPKNLDSLRLALCGWQQKDSDIIECRHCFRSLGLWLYRGAEPTMEHLDPIDSHLEYCPWRSPDSQDTEISIATDKEGSHKAKMSGWMLVYLAIVKRNHKGRAHGLREEQRPAETLDDKDVLPQLSPEQREKKMKDIMKRIKDLKRPFNVKSLLKRKEKVS